MQNKIDYSVHSGQRVHEQMAAKTMFTTFGRHEAKPETLKITILDQFGTNE